MGGQFPDARLAVAQVQTRMKIPPPTASWGEIQGQTWLCPPCGQVAERSAPSHDLPARTIPQPGDMGLWRSTCSACLWSHPRRMTRKNWTKHHIHIHTASYSCLDASTRPSRGSTHTVRLELVLEDAAILLSRQCRDGTFRVTPSMASHTFKSGRGRFWASPRAPGQRQDGADRSKGASICSLRRRFRSRRAFRPLCSNEGPSGHHPWLSAVSSAGPWYLAQVQVCVFRLGNETGGLPWRLQLGQAAPFEEPPLPPELGCSSPASTGFEARCTMPIRETPRSMDECPAEECPVQAEGGIARMDQLGQASWVRSRQGLTGWDAGQP
ncbi:hypothetical protein B0T11DRAFT_82407 [Plectosphaerella cucumerina]|uniref:Uncharacterized protein n=1 Tax=Plectosphaerella cucumerina TaxID=40658 RepID=A0A8K0TKX8_9PEZI|nr:hypothetical protein B0T11DRAFT_82407 [Plectosphaerella cucumerina]